MKLILAAAAAFFLVMWIQTCTKPTPPVDTSEFEQTIADQNRMNQKLQAEISALQAIRADEKKAYQKDSLNKASENKRLSARYSTAREEIKQLADSLPKVASFVSASDSLIQAQKEQIATEVAHRIRGEELFKIEIETMAESLLNKTAVNVMLSERNQELVVENDTLQKKVDRKTGWNKFWKGTAAALAVAVTVLTISK